MAAAADNTNPPKVLSLISNFQLSVYAIAVFHSLKIFETKVNFYPNLLLDSLNLKMDTFI